MLVARSHARYFQKVRCIPAGISAERWQGPGPLPRNFLVLPDSRPDMKKIIIALSILLFLGACSRCPADLPLVEGVPAIEPDYAGVTIPPAIAPLNFAYLGESPARVYANGQKVCMRGNLAAFGRRQWKKLLACDTISISVVMASLRQQARQG